MEEKNRENIPKSGLRSSDLSKIDRYRSFIFPNNIRQYRKARGFDSLLTLSQHILSTTYIRLSKIERGEIFARAEELKHIAAALDVRAEKLLIDIDAPDFDIALWAADHIGSGGLDEEADTLAVLLAAAMRTRRARDEALTIAVLERDFGIAPVILSRIENAFKPLDRWNPAIQSALFRLFDVKGAAALTAYLHKAHARGDWDAMLPLIANPADRMAKTRSKIRSLSAELATPPPLGRRRREPQGKRESQQAPRSIPTADGPAETHTSPRTDQPLAPLPLPASPLAPRMVPIYGAPLPDGLIAFEANGDQLAAPPHAGPRAYGLRIFRPSLGAGLPSRSILIVDPDRFPSAGGLAVLREAEGLRLLSVITDRQGRMIGFSEYPSREIALDDIDPKDMATVIAAQFE